MSNSLVSVVLPVYNQADHIGQVIEEYLEALQRVQSPHEIILVVNASRDNSLAVCHELAQQHPTVRIVSTEEKGWGRAVRLGLSEARGDLLCYTNSARTGAANLVLLILYAIANPGTVVKAHRTSRESLKRKMGSLLYNMQCRLLFDLPTWDINATPKVFSRDVYQAMNLRSAGDLIDLEFYIQCKEAGRVILEVPIYWPQRAGGQSTTNYRSALGMYLGAYQMWKAWRREGSAVAQ